MNNLQDENQQLQSMIEQIFPVMKEVPINSISSSINRIREDKALYFLIVGDNRLVKPFLNDTKEEAKIKAVLSAEKGYNKMYYDLIMDFTFYFKGGKAVFKIGYSAGQPDIQQQYLEALEEAESFRFIIVDQDRNLQKIVHFDWYYYQNKKVLQKIVKNNDPLYESI